MAATSPSHRGRAPQGGGTSTSRPRILRIGVLLGGKIVEERLIRERVPVTVGQSMKNTFSVPAEGLPLEFTLFALEEGRYHLRFLPKMDGRLSDGENQLHTLDALKQKGASNQGDYYSVPLGDAARGKLSLGDLTILFQLVAEPPRQPKPMLPASVRGTFADRIEPRLAVIVGASIVMHFALVLFFWFRDVEEGGLAERAYNLSFKQDTYQVDVAPEPDPQPAAAGSAAGSAAPVKDPGPAKPDSRPSTGGPREPSGGGRSDNTAPSMSDADAVALANLMSFDNTTGTTTGGMNDRAPGTDLGNQVAAVRESGKTPGIGGGTGRVTRGDGDPRTGTGKGPKIDGPGGTTTPGGGKGEEKGPTGRISVSDKQTFDESTLTPDIVYKKILSAYMTGIKRCYTNYLKKEATARGKVKLSFTVNESGRTVERDAKGFADEVDSCIGNLMNGWTFPKPVDKDGDGTEAGFAITLQLVPD